MGFEIALISGRRKAGISELGGVKVRYMSAWEVYLGVILLGQIDLSTDRGFVPRRRGKGPMRLSLSNSSDHLRPSLKVRNVFGQECQGSWNLLTWVDVAIRRCAWLLASSRPARGVAAHRPGVERCGGRCGSPNPTAPASSPMHGRAGRARARRPGVCEQRSGNAVKAEREERRSALASRAAAQRSSRRRIFPTLVLGNSS